MWPALVAMLAAVMAAPVAAAPPQAPPPGAVGQGDLQQLSVRVRALIRAVERSELPCETRNGVVRRLRSLDDALESGRRSAARAMLLAWMDHARSSVGTGVLSAEQGALLYAGMDQVLAQVGTGWPEKPKRTRHWKPLPSCAADSTGGVATYTPEAFDWTSYDSMVLTYSIVGLIPTVGSLLAGLVQLFWPADPSAPTVADIISTAVESGVKKSLEGDLQEMQSALNSLNTAIGNWQTDCKDVQGEEVWDKPDKWPAGSVCFTGAYHTYDVWDDTHRLAFEGKRGQFQDPDYQVDLLPLFVQYETLDMALLREGILLSRFWLVPGVGVGPSDAAVPRVQMNHHLNPDPTDVDPISKEPRGLPYVEKVFEAGLSGGALYQGTKLPAATDQASWTARNGYVRSMTVSVWDVAETWKYLDPDAYPTGAPGAAVPTRMVYSDPMANADQAPPAWGTYKGPANVHGPLTELIVWNQTWNDWNWTNHYKNMVEAVQSTSVPSAGPAKVGPLTGDASMETPARIHSKAPWFFDLRSTSGPIVAVQGSTYTEVGLAGQRTNVRPEWIKVTFADGSTRSTGDGNNDGVADHVYSDSQLWPWDPVANMATPPVGFDGYVLATVAATGIDDRGWDNGGKIADAVVFGFRRADSFLPTGSAVSLQSGKCLDLPSWASGTQPMIHACHAGEAQMWSYNPLSQQLSVEAPPQTQLQQQLNEPTRKCLTVKADAYTVVIDDCTGGSDSQRWQFVAAPGGQGAQVKSVATGKVLDVQSGGTADGTKVIAYTPHTGPNQVWNVPPAHEGPLHGLGYGRCLNVNGAGTANGTAVTMWTCDQPGNTARNQQWTYHPDTQALTVYAGTKCLQATGTAKGSGVAIWDCTGAADQQWTINADATITGVQSGLKLDVADSTADGDKVTLQPTSGGWNQRWSRPAEQGRAVVAMGAGKCLDLSAWADGTQALISTCAGTPTQRWTYHPLTKTLVTHSVDTSAGVDKCLAVDAGGTKAVIGPCTGAPEQQWLMGPGESISHTVQNVADGTCLTLPGTGTVTAAGTRVELQSCRTAEDDKAGRLQINQHWVGP